MKKIFIICSLLSLVLAQNQPPAWPKAYSVQGALFIPFAGNNKRLLLIILNKTIFIYLFIFFFNLYYSSPNFIICRNS